MREPTSPHFHYTPLEPDTLWTRGFVVMLFACVVALTALAHRVAAEASQVPALASEVGRAFGPEFMRLFGVVLFVGSGLVGVFAVGGLI